MEMTREEAKEILGKYVIATNSFYMCTSSEVIIAIGMAVKALSAETCDDCISRTDAINGFEDCSTQIWSDDTIKYLKSLPSVQPMRPKGKWLVDKERLGYFISECSNCNWRGHGNEVLIYKPKFCPNCGADMRGEE